VGDEPCPTNENPETFFDELKAGKRMSKGEHRHASLCAVMCKTWGESSEERRTFSQVVETLQERAGELAGAADVDGAQAGDDHHAQTADEDASVGHLNIAASGPGTFTDF